jgi:hypothetical protein
MSARELRIPLPDTLEACEVEILLDLLYALQIALWDAYEPELSRLAMDDLLDRSLEPEDPPYASPSTGDDIPY